MFVRAIFLAESAFYAVVPPLIPVFVAQTRMTTTEVGVLVAAYRPESWPAAIPAMMLVTRRGVRATPSLVSASWSSPPWSYAWSASPWLLDAARLTQGIGGASPGLARSPGSRTHRRRPRASVIGGAVGAA